MDQVGGLPRLAGLDVSVYAGAADAPLGAGEETPDWQTSKGAIQTVLLPLVGSPHADVTPVVDGDTVGSFTVYETPGHTPGHVGT